MAKYQSFSGSINIKKFYVSLSLTSVYRASEQNEPKGRNTDIGLKYTNDIIKPLLLL
ncbi:hypothetical protein [Providencia sp. Me31A]|uniref:hypothetical protein n=1 Tax=Providencia sp. Me31A TaxID=3392637 RepID=UPI003D2661AD